jgi:hypothetical protein
LCDNTSAIHVLKPHTCTEIKHVIHIASANDELKLLSSLSTLGYIEFDIFYNLNCLEDRFVQYADLPWFSRHTYHAIGKYNNKEHYMIHGVYICGNLKSHFVVQNCDRLEGCHTAKIVIQCSSSFVLKKSIPALSFVSTNLLQDSIGNHRVHSDPRAYVLAEIFV